MIKNDAASSSQNNNKEKEVMEIVNTLNPLPPEIAQMRDEETCCKFCGVSYLIHREVTRLQGQLKNFEQFHQAYLVGYLTRVLTYIYKLIKNRLFTRRKNLDLLNSFQISRLSHANYKLESGS